MLTNTIGVMNVVVICFHIRAVLSVISLTRANGYVQSATRWDVLSVVFTTATVRRLHDEV